jgi:hypothetical protein
MANALMGWPSLSGYVEISGFPAPPLESYVDPRLLAPNRLASWNSAMPRHISVGNYYVFDRARPGFEIGMQISRNAALFRVRSGGDVFTPAASDAISLAKDVHPGRAGWDGSHIPRPGNWDYGLSENRRFPHFHPGLDHATYGHVFYGQRGYRVGEARR